MNLIEQLGGYEKAKEKMDDICHTLDNSELLGGGDAREGLYERLESIDKALLEYRRQHNIFEVGDPMIIPSRGNGIFYFNALFSDSDTAEARHATDAEIAAGKRLEVK
ncbi:hypothetical protein [Acinetobacter sp. TUM15064]|uniref:hypothetical protein n=1 Tax=Acinetobacter sp. TUM15064 TaxID=2609134 RepID=UPI00124E6B5C|nr:hypothetical protein [Acinetobacter sp. TUM15064]